MKKIDTSGLPGKYHIQYVLELATWPTSKAHVASYYEKAAKRLLGLKWVTSTVISQAECSQSSVRHCPNPIRLAHVGDVGGPLGCVKQNEPWNTYHGVKWP